MEAIIAKPKNNSEFKLLMELLKKMGISSKVLTEEEKEDFGLLKLMQEADRTKKVSKNAVMAKLKSK
jgi:hypothetical protein